MTGYENYIGTTDPGIVQFENANEGRSYPFVDNTILTTVSGQTLPDSVITDMRLVIPKGTDAFLSSVYISKMMLSVCIKVVDTAMHTTAALSCTIKSSDLESYTPYRLEKLTGSEDVGGIITFGEIDFEALQGTYRFPDGTIDIAENAVSRYTPAKLRKFIDPRTGKELSGDVEINFSNYVTAEKTQDGIKLGISNAANNILLTDCDKTSVDNPCGATPVGRINGIPPDDKKRIVIWFH